MTDIFKSADWAWDVERAKAEAAKSDGIIGSDNGLEYVKVLFAEATKAGDEMERQAAERMREWYTADLPVPDGATLASLNIRIPVAGVFVGLGVDDSGAYARVMVDGEERKFYASKP